MTESFSLKWNDFHTNVSKSFGLFRNEDYLHDVTLISEDFKHIPANKFVLSACSEFFKNILKETKQTQPLLCLDGVNSIDLLNVLDYVYMGEVRILQDNLERFLSIAKRFMLEGLVIDVNDDMIGDFTEENKSKEVPSLNDNESEIVTDNNFGKDIGKVGVTPIFPSNTKVHGITKNGVKINKEKVDKNIIRNADGSKTCSLCGRTASHIGNLRKHVETHMDDLTYNCPDCEKSFRSFGSFLVHRKRIHNP